VILFVKLVNSLIRNLSTGVEVVKLINMERRHLYGGKDQMC